MRTREQRLEDDLLEEAQELADHWRPDVQKNALFQRSWYLAEQQFISADVHKAIQHILYVYQPPYKQAP